MLLNHHPDVMLELYRDRLTIVEREIERRRQLIGLPQSPSLWRRVSAVSWPFRKRELCPPVTPALPATTTS